jgi:hypothetical protein
LKILIVVASSYVVLDRSFIDTAHRKYYDLRWSTPSHIQRGRAQPVQVVPHATLRSQSHRMNPSQHYAEIFMLSKGTDLKCNPSAPYLEQ